MTYDELEVLSESEPYGREHSLKRIIRIIYAMEVKVNSYRLLRRKFELTQRINLAYLNIASTPGLE